MIKQNSILLLLLLVILISLCGCTDQEPDVSDELLTVNTAQDIDLLLEKTPVFIEIGAQRCPACREQKPIIEELTAKYGNRIQFIYIDSDKQPDLAGQFNIYYIPDMIVIVEKNNEKYSYATRYGTQTYDSGEAMMVGFTSKEILEVTIQHALTLRG